MIVWLVSLLSLYLIPSTSWLWLILQKNFSPTQLWNFSGWPVRGCGVWWCNIIHFSSEQLRQEMDSGGKSKQNPTPINVNQSMTIHKYISSSFSIRFIIQTHLAQDRGQHFSLILMAQNDVLFTCETRFYNALLYIHT